MPEHRHDRSQVTRVRLAGWEHEAFIAAAKRLNDTRSNLLRRAVREIINRPADLLEKELAALNEAVHQLKAVGRNLNQIARAVHTGEIKEAQVDPAVLAALRQSVETLAARFMEVMEASQLRRVFR